MCFYTKKKHVPRLLVGIGVGPPLRATSAEGGVEEGAAGIAGGGAGCAAYDEGGQSDSGEEECMLRNVRRHKSKHPARGLQPRCG